jgi:beta-galactosidase
LNEGWRFTRGDSTGNTSSLAYANAKAWMLPTGNAFVSAPADRATRPAGNLGGDVAYTGAAFDDGAWQAVNLPHDYAIQGPFSSSYSGNIGKLPSPGVVWYRKTFTLQSGDAGKSIFLDLDGAMSYSLVWLNGQFVGGWPYGYASYRLDLTPYVTAGGANVLAIRLDNPVPASTSWDAQSSRWYPGGGVYRNVWLVKAAAVHVAKWGTYVTTPTVSPASAAVGLKVTVDNASAAAADVTVATEIFELDAHGGKGSAAVASIAPVALSIPAGQSATAATSGAIPNPKLWGVGLHQRPNRYVAVTTVRQGGAAVDVYETPFGVRTLTFDPDAGFLLNGERVRLQGVNGHHDLGALGAAVNVRALQRQLEILAEMGVNAIRTSHNPPAPELLELADEMGFLVFDEAFDAWATQKVALDYHLLFPDWHERDLRAMIRRDRNHPSVILWGIGNEVSEQYDDTNGTARAAELTAICHDEDPTRPTVAGMNAASPTSAFAAAIDVVGLNYQGTGVRSGPPLYPVFHQNLPGKLVLGSETTATLSSRGVYAFPVAAGLGVPSGQGGQINQQVSSYDLYFADWAYAPDKEFASQDAYPYLGGEFVWSGFDYLGEPTPFDSRSSYFGIVDLAGFKKDRFWLYQANWRPGSPMAHILPHWTWPERVGLVTPVQVYTSGDEAELFLNGVSLGRKVRTASDYRLRWDDVVYAPGELTVVAYKKGVEWARDSVKTAGAPTQLLVASDRAAIAGDGKDLAFVTVTVADAQGTLVPRSMNPIHFAVSGPGELVATDNGDATDMTAFPSADRNAFNGLALAIVRAKPGQKGNIVVTATSAGLANGSATVVARAPDAAETGTVATPAFTPASGSYGATLEVTLATATRGATLYYTMTSDGSEPAAPTRSSTPYGAGIELPAGSAATVYRIKALAVKAGMSDSAVASTSFTIAPAAVATPSWAPASGQTYATDQLVTLSTATAGATIHYTMTSNGDDPTTPDGNSATYGSGIQLTVPASGSTTYKIKVIAVRDGLSDSTVVSLTYTLALPPAALPSFSPSPGIYATAQNVVITSATPGATVHYTMTSNGDDPTTPDKNSPAYTAPIPLAVPASGTTVYKFKAMAVAPGMNDSIVTNTAMYTIDPSWTGSYALHVTGTSQTANGATSISVQFNLAGLTDFTPENYTATFDIYIPSATTAPAAVRTEYPDGSYTAMYFDKNPTSQRDGWQTLTYVLTKANRTWPSSTDPAPLNSAANKFRVGFRTAGAGAPVEFYLRNLKVTNGTNTPLNIPIASTTTVTSLGLYTANGTASYEIVPR